MTFLDKLLDGVEVEWKTLGEVADFQNGFAFKSNLFRESGLPIVRITNIDGVNVDLTDVKYFEPDDYDKGNPLNYSIAKGDVLIAMSGATTGKVGYYDLDATAYLNQRVGKFMPRNTLLNNRFLYHLLLSKTDFLYILAGGGAQPNLSSTILKEKLQIPIPPLKIQQKIVGILDKFTKLTAELTAELTSRIKQYEFYREKLLSFEEGEVEWKPLGEVAKYSKDRIKFSELNENNYTGVENILQNKVGRKNSSYVPTSGNSIKYCKNDILIGNIRPYLKKIWFSDRSGGSNGDVLVIQVVDVNINPQFLYHILADDKFFDYNMKYARGAKMPRGNKDAILNYSIPIPPLEEQARIVSILDKFDTLTTSLKEGLPREIELRQKQYEYYRELLLSFPKKEKIKA